MLANDGQRHQQKQRRRNDALAWWAANTEEEENSFPPNLANVSLRRIIPSLVGKICLQKYAKRDVF